MRAGPAVVAVPGFPRWIVDAVATPGDRRDGTFVMNVRLRVKHRRLMLAWAVLTGKVRVSRRA